MTSTPGDLLLRRVLGILLVGLLATVLIGSAVGHLPGPGLLPSVRDTLALFGTNPARATTHGALGCGLLLFGFVLAYYQTRSFYQWVRGVRRLRKRDIWGSCLHLGVLTVLVGALLDSLLGYHGTLLLREGEGAGHVFQSGDRPLSLPFQVRLEKVELKYRQGSDIATTFQARLQLFGRGFRLAEVEVGLNDPVGVLGWSFIVNDYHEHEVTHAAVALYAESGRVLRRWSLGREDLAHGRALTDASARDLAFLGLLADQEPPALRFVLRAESGGGREVVLTRRQQALFEDGGTRRLVVEELGRVTSLGLTLALEPGRPFLAFGGGMLGLGLLAMLFLRRSRSSWNSELST